MRWFSPYSVYLSLLVSLLATSYAQVPAARQTTVEEALEDGKPVGTVFNGQEVPHMTELSGTTWQEDIAKGYWLVEGFSPWCGHCKALEPKLQTIYEFYYTSDPLPASSEPVNLNVSLNSFTRYYGLKFAKLDCVAFGTACAQAKVSSFPTIILFKDGEEIKRTIGDKSIKALSDYIEEVLEMIRPGSRPAGGVALPKVGAKTSPEYVEAPPEASPPSASSTLLLKINTKTLGVDQVVKKPTKAKALPNANGTSIAFNAETFQKQVTRTLDPWFIKFYAPWCTHCQKMAPSWSAMSREMEGRLNVGEVNCEVEKRLCREVRVNGFPTIVYFKGPERVHYDGLRGLGDFIDFGNKAIESNSGVKDVTAEEFEEMEATEEVIFVYFYDLATTSEDFMALERFPLNLIGRAKMVKTCDESMVRRFKITTWPRLLVSRSGKATVYEQLAPQDMRNVPKVVQWMQSVWLPLVPELTASNARDIMDGKFVVLGLLTRDRPEEFASAKREMKSAAIEWLDKQALGFKLERQELRNAKQLRIEEAEDRNDIRALRNAKLTRINMNDIERKEVAFAWVDGIFWERWIKTTFGISVKDGDKVIILDEDNHRYWDRTVTGSPIVPSRTSILETVPKVVSSPPKLASKRTGSSIMHYFYRARNTLIEHPWLSAGVLLGFLGIALGVYSCMGRRKRLFGANGGGFFQVDGRENGRLLGGGLPNGKAD